MKNLLDEFAYDADFLIGHKLQPAWFKVVKVFILTAVIAGFVFFFGWKQAAVFAAVFLILMLIVHMVYRAGTRKFTRNWLDFIVVGVPEKKIKPGIGLAYYASIVINATIAFLLSRLFTG